MSLLVLVLGIPASGGLCHQGSVAGVDPLCICFSLKAGDLAPWEVLSPLWGSSPGAAPLLAAREAELLPTWGSPGRVPSAKGICGRFSSTSAWEQTQPIVKCSSAELVFESVTLLIPLDVNGLQRKEGQKRNISVKSPGCSDAAVQLLEFSPSHTCPGVSTEMSGSTLSSGWSYLNQLIWEQNQKQAVYMTVCVTGPAQPKWVNSEHNTAWSVFGEKSI